MPDRFRGAPKGLARAPGSSGSHPAPATVLGQLLRPIRPTIIQPARPRPNRKREDQARRDDHLQLVASAMEAAAAGLMITGADGCIVWANAALARMTGYRVEELLGASPKLFKSGRHASSFFGDLWNTILSGGTWHGRLVNRRRDGALYSEEMTIAPVKDRCGALTHFVAVKRDLGAWPGAGATEHRPRSSETRQTASEIAYRLARSLDPTLPSGSGVD